MPGLSIALPAWGKAIIQKGRERIEPHLLLLLWLFPVVGFLLIISAAFNTVTPISVAQRLHNQPAGEIRGSFTVGQTFYSPYPGLSKIAVLLATYARPNHGQAWFHLTSDPNDSTRLVSIPFDASLVKDNSFQSFEFPPIGESAGKNYFFYLEAPAAGPGNAITAWSQSANPYSDGMAYFQARPVENDLAFVAEFRPSPWQLAETYLNRLASGKPGIWGSPIFYVITSFVYLALMGAILFLFWKAFTRRPWR